MSYIEANLIPGESVVYQTRLHWVVMLRHTLLGILLFAGCGAVLSFYLMNRQRFAANSDYLMEGGAAALFAVGVAAILAGMIRRYATEIAVTTRRVVVKQGLISRNTIEMLLNKVEAIEVREPTVGRLLGYGSIAVIGTGGTSEQFHKIAHPLKLRSEVQQQLEKLTPGPIQATELRSK